MNQTQYFAILARANAAISFAEIGDAAKVDENYRKLIEFVGSLVTR